MHHSSVLPGAWGGTGKTTLLMCLCDWWQITRSATNVFCFGYAEHMRNLQQVVRSVMQKICDEHERQKLQALGIFALEEEVILRM